MGPVGLSVHERRDQARPASHDPGVGRAASTPTLERSMAHNCARGGPRCHRVLGQVAAVQAAPAPGGCGESHPFDQPMGRVQPLQRPGVDVRIVAPGECRRRVDEAGQQGQVGLARRLRSPEITAAKISSRADATTDMPPPRPATSRAWDSITRPIGRPPTPCRVTASVPSAARRPAAGTSGCG